MADGWSSTTDRIVDDRPAPPLAASSQQGSLKIASLLPRGSAEPSTAAVSVRLAIACMTKQPLGFQTWLEYHRAIIGVARFYIRVEDTPELAQLFATPPWSTLVEATFCEGEDLVRDNGTRQTDRQVEHVGRAIVRAREAGMTHLLHCDDDELLYAPSGVDNLRRELAAADNSQRGASDAFQLHALTLEALYPSVLDGDDADPFRHAAALRHQPPSYSSYGALPVSTGKAIVSCLQLFN